MSLLLSRSRRATMSSSSRSMNMSAIVEAVSMFREWLKLPARDGRSQKNDKHDMMIVNMVVVAHCLVPCVLRYKLNTMMDGYLAKATRSIYTQNIQEKLTWKSWLQVDFSTKFHFRCPTLGEVKLVLEKFDPSKRVKLFQKISSPIVTRILGKSFQLGKFDIKK